MRVLAEKTAVVLYGRTRTRADAAAHRLGVAGAVEVAALDTLAPEPGDVVVSMLPATEHPRLLELSLRAGAHFADTSYASDEVIALAKDADVVVLTEAGLDPGIDHLLADDLVADAKQAVDGPATAAFTSYCGGIPAVPNEFRYRFSWAPLGVLTALLSPARYVSGGVETVAERPWEAVSGYRVHDEDFEVYPNRDSISFVTRYGIPPSWSLTTFVRGTIRLAGWRSAWEPVFAQLRAGDPDRISELASELALRYPTTEADRDRVVLAVALTVDGEDGTTWSGRSVVDLVGDEHGSAMARLVSTTVAVGVQDILAGRLSPGPHRGAEGAVAARHWLESLRDNGIEAVRVASSTAGTVTSA